MTGPAVRRRHAENLVTEVSSVSRALDHLERELHLLDNGQVLADAGSHLDTAQRAIRDLYRVLELHRRDVQD